MRVQEVMTAAVQTVPAVMSADEAWTVMRTKGIRHLVVLERREVAGIVSDRDLGGRRGAAIRANHSVGELMTTPVVIVPPDTLVRRAANMMRGRSIGCLVVGTATRVAGIVTTADLLELVGRGIDRQADISKRWTLKHRAPHRKGRGAATGVW